MYKLAVAQIKQHIKEAQERRRSWLFPAAMLGGAGLLNLLVLNKMFTGDRSSNEKLFDYDWRRPMLEFVKENPTFWDNAKRYLGRASSAVSELTNGFENLKMDIRDNWMAAGNPLSLPSDTNLKRQESAIFMAPDVAVNALRKATEMAAGIKLPK